MISKIPADTDEVRCCFAADRAAAAPAGVLVFLEMVDIVERIEKQKAEIEEQKSRKQKWKLMIFVFLLSK